MAAADAVYFGRFARSPCRPEASAGVRCHSKCHRRRSRRQPNRLPLYRSARPAWNSP